MKLKKFLHNFTGHLKTVNAHKKLVRQHCFRLGLYKQGILHDLSKYSPTEFIPGVKYYQGNRSPNNAQREAEGCSTAWLHHKGRNKHHMEYWIDYGIPDKEGPHKGEHKGLCGMKMPVNYVVEMYIDRVAASKNYQKEKYRDDSALAYYMNGRQFHVLHDDTRALLELLLEMLAIKGEKATNRFIREEVLSHKIPYEKEPLLQLKEQLEKGS